MNRELSAAIGRAAYEDIINIRNKAPIVHNITNFVVMQQNFVCEEYIVARI